MSKARCEEALQEKRQQLARCMDELQQAGVTGSIHTVTAGKMRNGVPGWPWAAAESPGPAPDPWAHGWQDKVPYTLVGNAGSPPTGSILPNHGDGDEDDPATGSLLGGHWKRSYRPEELRKPNGRTNGELQRDLPTSGPR